MQFAKTILKENQNDNGSLVRLKCFVKRKMGCYYNETSKTMIYRWGHK